MKHRLPLLIILSIVYWALFALFFKVNYWQNHDGNYHLQRAFAAVESLKTGQIPLRWSSLLNFGCGLPVFNYYYPLIYYLFGFLGSLNINLIFSYKIILGLFYIVGTVSTYFFIYQLLKSRGAALIGAILFALNPYYLQLIYVRANPELLAYSLLPLILLFILRSKYFLLFIGLILYLLSHNTVILITLPLIIAFIGCLFFKNKKIDYFLIITFILAILTSSFFLGPALLEKKYVKLGTNIAADYQQHYSTLKQLFFSPWGWGYSTSDANDGMSFKFGYVQWLVLALSLLVAITNHKILYLSLSILFFLFLSLSPSQYIWEKFPIFQQLQYPWRILGLCVFLITILAPLIYITISLKYRPIFLVFIIVASIVTNRNHIQAVSNRELPDFTRIGSTTIADELLPATAVNDCYLDSNKLSYFPNAYIISQNKHELNYHDCSGYVCLDSGDTSTKNFTWQYQSTPIQNKFNYLSIISLISWIILAFLKHK